MQETHDHVADAGETRAWLQQSNHHLLQTGEDAFPEMLASIPSPARRLFLAGDPLALALPAVAIVGSRNPTQGGARTAYEFARFLAGSGFTIVSGLAQGIDTQAHSGALDAGGRTVAFLGHGIDRVYPAANRELAHRIVASGALVSEFPLGTPPHKTHFPQRNRLISGLSLGTLVVEAARQSGSLITARLAGEQGREVFAIPGSIHNPMARGCHWLIRNGARLVETADDILEELAPLLGHMAATEGVNATPVGSDPAPLSEVTGEQKTLLDIMGHDPVSLDELSELSGLTIDQLSSMLLILELEGRVEKLSGGRYSALHRTGPDAAAPDTE
ncbi:MAG: DNA-processing protein DprA [Pseudomonadota bacterium]